MSWLQPAMKKFRQVNDDPIGRRAGQGLAVSFRSVQRLPENRPVFSAAAFCPQEQAILGVKSLQIVRHEKKSNSWHPPALIYGVEAEQLILPRIRHQQHGNQETARKYVGTSPGERAWPVG